MGKCPATQAEAQSAGLRGVWNYVKGMVIYMSNFEKRFGKYAIKNLTLILILCYVVGYIIEIFSPESVFLLTLDPYKILHGQIWRLVSWVLVPPESLNLFTIIMLYFYYSVGTTLENTWGDFRYNVYLFLGMIFTIIGSFAAMGLGYLFYGDLFAIPGIAEQYISAGSAMFSTYYINMSILLAFAATFPNVQVLLMFVIPVKMKWLGIAYGVYMALQLIVGTGTGIGIFDLFTRCAIVASLLNFVVFWLMSRSHIHMTPKQIKRRQAFKHEVKVNSKVTKHKCAICGRTDEEEGLEFRFCSKCEGNYEYCQHHLFTHQHVVK